MVQNQSIMVRSFALLSALLLWPSVFGISCSKDSHCPKSAPCCSQYGDCGIGAFCLGGCDPLSSFSPESCTPAPMCKSKKHKFDSKLSTILPDSKYLGDPSSADWVSTGQPVYYNDNVLLTMAPNTVGTLLASTRYMWYGNVKAKFKTARGKGVVTAFILLSDFKDEIDYEFIGADLSTAQTNYYSMGIPNYENSVNISISNTFIDYHTYEINWTPDEITWIVDGKIGRTRRKADTWNATSNQWSYPQTPARVQLSLWPAGLESNAKGTIDWAGGLVDWNSADIKSNNYYYAAFESIEINCYDADSGLGTSKGKSYTYDTNDGSNITVIDGNKNTILKSFLASGLNPDAGASPGPSVGISTGSPARIPSNDADRAPGGVGIIPGVQGPVSDISNQKSTPDSNGGANDSPEQTSGSKFSQGDIPSSTTSLTNQSNSWMRSCFMGLLAILMTVIL